MNFDTDADPVPPDGLQVVYAGDAFVVLDKPAGLLSVPGKGDDKQDCLSARAQAEWPDALVVHRLDMATSGLLVMARGIDMQRRLSAQFEARTVDKTYVAVVHGGIDTLRFGTADADGWRVIDAPILLDWPRRPLHIIDAAQGRPSQTRWRVLAPVAGAAADAAPTTRVELEPITGRTHQLRVHLQSIGHPILGDRLYAPPAVQSLAPRLLLHARALGFDHPATGERLHFGSPVPF